jgi:hypothetical protein
MKITRFAALLAAFLILSLDLKAQNKPISQMDTVVVFTDSMFVPIVDPGEALAVNRNKRFFIRQLDGRYQLKNSNLTSLAGLSANGNLKKIDNGLITADTLNLKADTLIAETQLFFRGDSLIKVIQDNSSALNVVGNVNNRVLTATGADSIQGEGNFTFDGSQLQVLSTTNQLRLGTTNTTTITSPAPAASLTYTIPDAGSASNFMLSATGATNRIPYWSSATRLTNSANLTFDGTTLTTTGLILRRDQASGFTQQIIRNDTDGTGNGAGLSISASTNNIILNSYAPTHLNYPDQNRFTTNGKSIIFSTNNLATDHLSIAATTGSVGITNTGSTAGLTVTKSGSGNGITVTNSGSGLAGQFGNIGINANTISSTNTDGNILLTPNGTGYTDVTAGGLRIAGTQRISNAGNATLVNLTTTGTHTHGANARSIELYKTVTLTDATATTIATLTLPTGGGRAGSYTVQISGIVQNSGSTTFDGSGGNIAAQRIDATLTFAQGAAGGTSGVVQTITLGTKSVNAPASRDIASATLDVAISGTDNSVHAIRLTVTGSGANAINLNFIGEIKVHRSFTSLTAN